MRNNTKDKTLKRNYIQKYRFLIREYELVKAKKHPGFRFVQDFYKAHNTNRQTFLKYYNRYKIRGRPEDLLPQKRGPKWKTRRPLRFIEEKVLECRRMGKNKYEIHQALKEKLKKFTPSPSGIYNICKRYNLNQLTPKMKESKRKIIKTRAGELGHIDVHYLSKDIIVNDNQRYYLVALVDSCTRVAWVEVTSSIKSLDVMFMTLRCIHQLQAQFGIQFEEILSDNGPEFSGRGRTKKPKNILNHPFERMLIELGIKHRYTRPYRPQTNGKVERFWRTIEADLFENTTFDSIEHLQEELFQYLVYYNYDRPHQALNGLFPSLFLNNLSTN